MLTYQWQESTDDGITWFDVTPTGSFTGSQSSSLLVNDAIDEYDGNLYRCIVSNSYGAVTSSGAELRIKGHMRSAGANYHGQLGVGFDNTGSDFFIKVSNDHWKDVACGGQFTLAIRTDGTLWSWGWNDSGQLGQGTTGSGIGIPTQIGTGSNWAQVSANQSYGAALDLNGTIWTWGSNTDGELGQGTMGIPQTTPSFISGSWKQVACGQAAANAIGIDNTLWGWGGGSTDIVQIPATDGTGSWYGDWVWTSAGSDSVFAISSSGQWWDIQGPPGTSITLRSADSWSMIAAGQYVVGGIKATDGTLWMYGANDQGELGQGYTGSSIEVLTQVGTYSWKNLACGYNSTYAIRSDETGWVWGANNAGLLGLGDENDRWSPTQIGTQLWSKIAGGVDSTVALFI